MDGGIFMKNRRNLHTQIVLVGLILSIFNFGALADEVSGLAVAIQNAKNSCSGISDSMSDLKRRAGISTAVAGVGTLSAGVGLGVGVAKSAKDKEFDEKIGKSATRVYGGGAVVEYGEITDDMVNAAFDRLEKEVKEYEKIDSESKTLGNVRTGTLAGTAVLDTAGTIIAAKNKVGDDLQTKIDNCVKSIKNLQNERMRAQTENTATDIELSTANKIITNCRDWEFIDLSPINKRATGAVVSGGTGAALSVIGAITSASANSDSVRSDNSDAGKQKEKNLNVASNVLAGGATAASGVATVFNATQISAIKKAAEMSDKCEGALK